MKLPEKYLGISLLFVSVLIAVLLTSCGILQVKIENPSEPTMTLQPAESSETPGTPEPSETSYTSIAPHASDTPEPTGEHSQPLRIVFGEGDTTWTRVEDLNEGEVNRFVIYALGGQIMSVFAKPSGMGVLIIGNDGSILKDKDDFQSFWRGELPSTQDYLIELDPTQSGVDQVSDRFSISVVVNPAGELIQFFDHVDQTGGFKLRYSDYFTVDRSPNFSPVAKGPVILHLAFIGTEFYEDTNLSEAYIYVAVSRDPDVVSSCTTPDLQEEVGGTVEINEITFQQSTFEGVALGNIYEQTIHRTAYNDACYEVVFWLHSNAIGAYPEGLVHEFDANRVLQLMREVLSSFEFL